MSLCTLSWLQSCLILCDPMDCSLPGSSVHGILQARIMEWVAIPCSKGPSRPRDRTLVSCTAGRFFAMWATKEDSTQKNILIAQQTFCHLVVRTKLIFPGLFFFSLDYDCGLVACEHVIADQKLETWSMKEVLAIFPFIYSIFSRVKPPLWIRTGFWEGVMTGALGRNRSHQ